MSRGTLNARCMIDKQPLRGLGFLDRQDWDRKLDHVRGICIEEKKRFFIKCLHSKEMILPDPGLDRFVTPLSESESRGLFLESADSIPLTYSAKPLSFPP